MLLKYIHYFVLFSEYTQNNCQFECQPNIASEKCQCVPWDYPHLNATMSICDRFGRYCFMSFMANTTIFKNCGEDCPYECATTR